LAEGLLMLAKYFIPIILFIFAYHSLKCINDYLAWLKRINRVLVIYICVHGFAPIGQWEDSILGWNFFGGEHGYMLAMFLGVPLSLYVQTKEKKYLLYALVYAIPSVTYMRRAAFAAYSLVLSLFLVYKYKIKGLILVVLLFVGIVFAILSSPELRERFFGGDRGKQNATSVSFEDLESGDVQINSSGRDAMWAIVTQKFYINKEYLGSGLGTMKKFLISEDNKNRRFFLILHNDYLHLLCETGLIGLFLWVVFYLSIFISLLKSILKNKNVLLRYSSLMNLGAFLSLGLIMYYANVVSSPNIFILPFILLGFHLKIVEIVKKDNIERL
jgi:O-antigen ligase